MKHSCSNVVITGQYLPNLLSLLPVSLCIYSVTILITTSAITSISIKTNKQIDTEYPYCFCLNTLCCPLDFTTGSILFASSVRVYSSILSSVCNISLFYITICILKKVKLFSLNVMLYMSDIYFYVIFFQTTYKKNFTFCKHDSIVSLQSLFSL